MSIKSFFKNLFPAKPHISFKAVDGGWDIGTPVVEARRTIPEYVKKQIKKHRENKFATCPGMFDHSQAGYLICAPWDIHVKVNKQGVVIKMDNVPPKYQAAKMDYNVVEGIVSHEGIPGNAWKFPLPWSIKTKKGYSAHVVPAFFHFPFCDRLSFYPGVVDYEEFHTVNAIGTFTKEGEFTIYAGTPLLQVIPYKREHFTAECGRATTRDEEHHRFGFFSRQKNFYRKMFHFKKLYTMTKASK